MKLLYNRMTDGQIRHSQNFIKSRSVASKIVSKFQLQLTDEVIEIGPGKGALTDLISTSCANVIGVEKDPVLAELLRNKFKNRSNIQIVCEDFLSYNLPSKAKYKIVGNIPFQITTKILKKILDNTNIDDAYFIVQREAAMRLMGSAYAENTENLFSLKCQPYFSVQLLATFKRNDFVPYPRVLPVMIKIHRKQFPDLIDKNYDNYLRFVAFGFTAWKTNVFESLRKLLSHKQLAIASDKYKVDLKSKPSDLSYNDWLNLFNFYQNCATNESQQLLEYRYQKLLFSQRKIVKSYRTRLY